jgi:hypothetical protein
MLRQTRATIVVSHPPRFSTSSAPGPAHSLPGVLDGVVGLAERAQHPIGDGAQVGPVLVEAFSQPPAVFHVL